MTVYEFKISDFRSEYPKFDDDQKYPDDVISTAYNIIAELFHNDDSSIYPYNPAQGIYLRKRLIDLGVCHVLSLQSLPDGQTGRVASASQGSVSTSFDLIKTNSMTGDWWMQTKCGQMVWLLLLPYIRGSRIYAGSKYHPWG